TRKEFENLRSHFVTAKSDFSKKRFMPYAFTEQGVAMLSGVLKSEKAIEISINIMDAFVAMRKFLSKNADLFNRVDKIERKQIEFEFKTDKNFEKVFELIQEKDIRPEKGIFFEGQVFDAYKFVSDLIKSARKDIILIDNYIDTTVLTLMSHKKPNVEVKIYSKTITEKLKLAKDKFNKQYGSLTIKNFTKSHDRFLIIDEKELYHIGASLKDLGKRWFAFSRLNKDTLKLLENLQ
ncbi:MAG: ORF6N domain-containing protein, partial [Nanobdellota archaeon]